MKELYDTYFTELKKLGYELCLDAPAFRQNLFYSWHTGTVRNGQDVYPARLRQSASNLRVLAIDAPDDCDLFASLEEYRNRHRFRLAFRMLSSYVFSLSFLPSMCLCLWCILTGKWFKLFVIFSAMTVVRMIYDAVTA